MGNKAKMLKSAKRLRVITSISSGSLIVLGVFGLLLSFKLLLDGIKGELLFEGFIKSYVCLVLGFFIAALGTVIANLAIFISSDTISEEK